MCGLRGGGKVSERRRERRVSERRREREERRQKRDEIRKKKRKMITGTIQTETLPRGPSTC